MKIAKEVARVTTILYIKYMVKIIRFGWHIKVFARVHLKIKARRGTYGMKLKIHLTPE